jgi:hypothetical protein
MEIFRVIAIIFGISIKASIAIVAIIDILIVLIIVWIMLTH